MFARWFQVLLRLPCFALSDLYFIKSIAKMGNPCVRYNYVLSVSTKELTVDILKSYRRLDYRVCRSQENDHALVFLQFVCGFVV